MVALAENDSSLFVQQEIQSARVGLTDDVKGKLVESGSSDSEELNDVAEALKQLGYKPTEIRPVIKKLANEKGSTDELIRKALALLMK